AHGRVGYPDIGRGVIDGDRFQREEAEQQTGLQNNQQRAEGHDQDRGQEALALVPKGARRVDHADLHYFRPDWAPARTESSLPWRPFRPVSMLRRALGGTGMLPRLDLVRAGMSRRRQRRN